MNQQVLEKLLSYISATIGKLNNYHMEGNNCAMIYLK